MIAVEIRNSSAELIFSNYIKIESNIETLGI